MSSLIISYLIGSIPFSYIWTRLFKNKDIREVASKNAGTTNVMMNVGVIPGILTMIGDVMKGVLAARIGAKLPVGELGYILPAVAIAGHNWPIWLSFRGGGGLATFIGSGLYLVNWWSLVLVLLIWGILFFIMKSHDKSALLTCIISPAIVLLAGKGLNTFLFYLSSSIVIGLRRLQSMRCAA